MVRQRRPWASHLPRARRALATQDSELAGLISLFGNAAAITQANGQTQQLSAEDLVGPPGTHTGDPISDYLPLVGGSGFTLGPLENNQVNAVSSQPGFATGPMPEPGDVGDFQINFASALGSPQAPGIAGDERLGLGASAAGPDAGSQPSLQWGVQTNQNIDLIAQQIDRPLTEHEQANVALLTDPNLACTPEPSFENAAGPSSLNDPNETYISQGPSATELGAQRRQTEQTRGAIGAILAGPIAIPGTVAAASASTVLLSGPAALPLRANILIGSGVNGTLNVVGQLQANGQIRFSEVVIATGFGALAGPLAAHSNLAGVMLVGGGTNAGQTAVTNYVFEGDDESAAQAFVVGTVLGPIGRYTGGIVDRWLLSNTGNASANIRATIGQTIDAAVSNSSAILRETNNANSP